MSVGKTDIEELLIKAKCKDEQAIDKLLLIFKPLIKKNSYINGKLNEDFAQELSMEFVKSIEKFKLK